MFKFLFIFLFSFSLLFSDQSFYILDNNSRVSSYPTPSTMGVDSTSTTIRVVCYSSNRAFVQYNYVSTKYSQMDPSINYYNATPFKSYNSSYLSFSYAYDYDSPFYYGIPYFQAYFDPASFYIQYDTCLSTFNSLSYSELYNSYFPSIDPTSLYNWIHPNRPPEIDCDNINLNNYSQSPSYSHYYSSFSESQCSSLIGTDSNGEKILDISWSSDLDYGGQCPGVCFFNSQKTLNCVGALLEMTIYCQKKGAIGVKDIKCEEDQYGVVNVDTFSYSCNYEQQEENPYNDDGTINDDYANSNNNVDFNTSTSLPNLNLGSSNPDFNDNPSNINSSTSPDPSDQLGGLGSINRNIEDTNSHLANISDNLSQSSSKDKKEESLLDRVLDFSPNNFSNDLSSNLNSSVKDLGSKYSNFSDSFFYSDYVNVLPNRNFMVSILGVDYVLFSYSLINQYLDPHIAFLRNVLLFVSAVSALILVFRGGD